MVALFRSIIRSDVTDSGINFWSADNDIIDDRPLDDISHVVASEELFSPPKYRSDEAVSEVGPSLRDV